MRAPFINAAEIQPARSVEGFGATLLASCCVFLAGQGLADDKIACGPNAIAVAAGIVNASIPTESQIDLAFGAKNADSHSFEELATAAVSLGCKTRFVRYDPGNPQLPAHPVIARLDHFDSNRPAHHFVVLYGSIDRSVQIIDFPRKPSFLSVVALPRFWNGEGMEILPEDDDSLDLPVLMNRAIASFSVLLLLCFATNCCWSERR